MKHLAREAHELSDLIGKEHALAILAERVDQIRQGPDIQQLSDAIEGRRQALLAELLPLGQRLFHGKPRKVARLLERAPA
jgi:hypothetical protein